LINSFKNYLVEEEKTIYFTFGRMNPPTIGHEKLLNALSAKSGKNPYRVFLSQTQDSKKNPLTYGEKVKLARKMFPKYARSIMLDKKVKTVFKGQVLSVLKFRGSNPTILIQHGNYITAYKNLSKVYVSKGDVLESGQPIGEVFTNKTNSQSTIQFSIFKKTTPLNPLFWILKM